MTDLHNAHRARAASRMLSLNRLDFDGANPGERSRRNNSVIARTCKLERGQSLTNRVACQLCDAADVQLVEYVLAVRRHCLDTDVQTLCDLLSRVAFGDQLYQLALPRRQRERSVARGD